MSATSNRHRVSIEADPTVPMVRITRDFDATPAQMMQAHTDPELFARWAGPDGLATKILDWDATSGGRWRYVANGRTRLHAQSLVDSFADRDQCLSSAMETGLEEGYAKLDALVAELR